MLTRLSDILQALGFHIWVAELELLLGQVKGSTANIEPVAALELLQKLLVTIDSSQRERVREYQRRCEEALMEVLFKGSAPPVRPTFPEQAATMMHSEPCKGPTTA